MKKKVAVFSTTWSPDLLYQYMQGVQKGFEKEQVDVYLFLSNASIGASKEYKHAELNVFQLPDLANFDAAFIFANGLDFPGVVEELQERCKRANIPVVLTGRKIENEMFVGSDNRKGMQDLCKHLVENHGVKHTWFIAGAKDNMDSKIRLETTRATLEEYGYELSEEDVVYTDWRPIFAIDFLNSKMDQGCKLPDAIICANDTLAIAMTYELEAKGMHIPEDVIVTGFDNEYASRVFWPSITSVNQRFDQIGFECAKAVIDAFNEKEHAMDTQIACEFVIGESCGCPCGHAYDRLRRELGRKRYIDQIAASFFDMNLFTLEHSVKNANDFTDLSNRFKQVYSAGHMFEGDSFHILIDPLYEASVYEREVLLREDGYSSKMDVLISMNKGELQEFSGFDTKELIPQVKANDANSVHLFLPLQEEGKSIGYIVFCDQLELLHDMNHLRRYVERVDSVLGIYLRDRRVEVLHSRLLDMTRTDALTHVKNRAAYEEREQMLQNKINTEDDLQFGIAIFDINNLKMFNDQLGHEAGDAYILASCKLICKVFKHSAVYRIGGDEFVAVLEGEDYENRTRLIEELNEEMMLLRQEDLLPQDKVSVAAGVATYKREIDTIVTDVFRRADGRMYENKITMKAQGW